MGKFLLLVLHYMQSIVISEFGPMIYMVKAPGVSSTEELKKIPQISDLIGDQEFELKQDNHGIWIIRFNFKSKR